MTEPERYPAAEMLLAVLHAETVANNSANWGPVTAGIMSVALSLSEDRYPKRLNNDVPPTTYFAWAARSPRADKLSRSIAEVFNRHPHPSAELAHRISLQAGSATGFTRAITRPIMYASAHWFRHSAVKAVRINTKTTHHHSAVVEASVMWTDMCRRLISDTPRLSLKRSLDLVPEPHRQRWIEAMSMRSETEHDATPSSFISHAWHITSTAKSIEYAIDQAAEHSPELTVAVAVPSVLRHGIRTFPSHRIIAQNGWLGRSPAEIMRTGRKLEILHRDNDEFLASR